MSNTIKSWPDYHHRINLIYHAVIALSLVPFAIVFMDIDTGIDNESKISDSLEWVIVLSCAVATGMTSILVWKGAKERMSQIDTDPTIKERLITYLKFQVKRYLWLELGAVLSLIGLWLTANHILVITYLLVLVQFSFLRPSQDKVIRDLGFTKEERNALRNDEL